MRPVGARGRAFADGEVVPHHRPEDPPMPIDTSVARFTLSREARLVAGVTLLTVPTIQYGGAFLLQSLVDKSSGYMDNPLRQNFFRAGHAHAGVIVILSLICQVLADAARLPTAATWLVRWGIPVSAILISAGFFLSVPAPTATVPSRAVILIYAGALLLAAGVLVLGIGLLRA
jgi:hypothetical protein